MNLALGVLDLDLSNLHTKTSPICDESSQGQRNPSPCEKSLTLRYLPSPEHISPHQTPTKRVHPTLHPGKSHLGLDLQQLAEENLKQFYGIDVNRCTDVSTLQRLLADGFRNFLYTTQWYESMLHERNKTFAHRLGELKKYIGTGKLHEAPKTVVPVARRMRSGSISAETPRLVTDVVDGGDNINGTKRELEHFSLQTDRLMTIHMHPHAQHYHNRLNLTESQQSTPGLVKPCRSLSRPVLLRKPHSASLIFSNQRLRNRSGTPVPLSSGRRTPLWYPQRNTQLLLAPSSARSRQHARHRSSGRKTTKGDDSTPITHRPPCIFSCKASASMAIKDSRLGGIVGCSDMRRQSAGAHSSREKKRLRCTYPRRQVD
ncbi:unnamed protein product [Phytomonas sp. EM1]|nr:unnamed protein product [Phytomonas sp. EM1]|eukprot:CCW61111.1 unnamed protein product [Phytomonas sp. isolate EM1]